MCPRSPGWSTIAEVNNGRYGIDLLLKNRKQKRTYRSEGETNAGENVKNNNRDAQVTVFMPFPVGSRVLVNENNNNEIRLSITLFEQEGPQSSYPIVF